MTLADRESDTVECNLNIWSTFQTSDPKSVLNGYHHKVRPISIETHKDHNWIKAAGVYFFLLTFLTLLPLILNICCLCLFFYWDHPSAECFNATSRLSVLKIFSWDVYVCFHQCNSCFLGSFGKHTLSNSVYEREGQVQRTYRQKSWN